MGKLSKLEIVIKNQNCVCFSGKPLLGNLSLELSSRLKVKEILLRFHGHASVYWNERHYNGYGKNKREVLKHFSGDELYFDHTVILYGNPSGELQTLSAGTHSFPFEFHVPNGCPTSYEGSIGKVRYYVSARVIKMFDIEYTTMKLFTVINPFDLNTDTRLQQCAEASDEMTLCCMCCRSGPISVTLFLESIGFVPGEGIPIHVEISNNSRRKISAASMTLLMVVKYTAEKKTKSHTNIVASICKKEWRSGKTDIWTGERLIIPSVPPSYLSGCDIIDISYVLELKVFPSGPAFTLPVKMEIVIGSVPLMNSIKNLSYHEQHPQPAIPKTVSGFEVSEIDVNYTESVLGKVKIEDEKENDKIKEVITFSPVYPYYTITKKTDTFQVNTPKTETNYIDSKNIVKT